MKILVVDDLAENRYLLEQLLSAKIAEVVSAVDGIEALDKLGAATFDLIIADIMMPRMDGYEFCYNVKLNPAFHSIPFVFYTATYTTDSDRAFALSLGADAFIVKPEEPEVFVRHINEVLTRASKSLGDAPRLALRHDQVTFLKGYNERLVQKLDQKFREAHEVNLQLNELNHSLEQRVREKTTELERSNKELEAFAYTLTHDLRSPLRAIEGYSDALRDSALEKFSVEERSFLDKILSSTARMDRMIQDVLDYSSIGADLTCARVDVGALVEDIVQSSPRFQGRTEITNPLHPVIAHEASLRQALSNLMSNAIKFTRPGVEPRVRVGSELRNGNIRLWIEDNGIGIAPEHLPKLFHLFERLHPKYEGNGIGLAIVAKAVERMHGKVGVETDVEKGSRFWLELPPAG